MLERRPARGVRLAAQAGRAGRQRLGDRAVLARARRFAAGAAALGRARRRRGRQRRITPGRHVPGLAARRARRRRARARLLDAGLDRSRRAARWSISWRRRRASRSRVERRLSATSETAFTRSGHVVRGAARDRRRRDGVGDAPRLDRGRGRERARAQRHAARRGRAEPQLGLRPAGREPRAAHARAPGSARAQRLGRGRARPAAAAPGLGRRREPRLGGRHVDAYTVDMPAGTTAAPRSQGWAGHDDAGALGDARPTRRSRPSPASARAAAQIALPAGRSLLVVARSQGAGPYTLALSGASATLARRRRPRRAAARRPPGDGAAEQHDVAHQVEPHEQHRRAAEGLQRGKALDRAHVERQRLERQLQQHGRDEGPGSTWRVVISVLGSVR